MNRIDYISRIPILFCISFFFAGTHTILAGDIPEKPRYAVVNLPANFLREKPDYTSELGTQAFLGDIVEILERDGYWVKVKTSQPYTAWCTDLGLVEMNEEEIEAYRTAMKYICVSRHSIIYSKPSDKSAIICEVLKGDVVRIAFDKKSMPAAVKGFAVVTLPDGSTGYMRKKDVEEYGSWLSGRNPTPDNIISEAMQLLGVPYLWGGMSVNGVDCSGFTRFVYMMNGKSLPRNASQQATVGEDINLKDISKGDLMFFGSIGDSGKLKITHVAIYIGNGLFIHASHKVRISSLCPDSDLYYENSNKLLKIKRL